MTRVCELCKAGAWGQTANVVLVHDSVRNREVPMCGFCRELNIQPGEQALPPRMADLSRFLRLLYQALRVNEP